jgi:hypothetical protein
VSSAKISLNGRSPFTITVGINRKKPNVVEERMNETQWTRFCDQVDIVLMPIIRMQYIRLPAFISFAVLVAVVFLELEPQKHQLKRWLKNDVFRWLLVAAGVMFFLVIFFSCCIVSLSRTVYEKLDALCEETSIDEGDLNLCLRDKNRHKRVRKRIGKMCIEVSASAVPTVPVSSPSSRKSNHDDDASASSTLSVLSHNYADQNYDESSVPISDAPSMIIATTATAYTVEEISATSYVIDNDGSANITEPVEQMIEAVSPSAHPAEKADIFGDITFHTESSSEP